MSVQPVTSPPRQPVTSPPRQPAASAPRQSVIPLPDFDQLRPRQQIAMDCARCGRHLGASGRKWGEIRHRGLPFVLWICDPGCAQAVTPVTPVRT